MTITKVMLTYKTITQVALESEGTEYHCTRMLNGKILSLQIKATPRHLENLVELKDEMFAFLATDS